MATSQDSLSSGGVALPSSNVFQAIASGGTPSSSELHALREHLPLLRAAARRALSSKDDALIDPRPFLEDARQDAIVGFLEAKQRYDRERGTTLGIFAKKHVYFRARTGVVRESDFRTRVDRLPSDATSDNDDPDAVPRPEPVALVVHESGYDEVEDEIDRAANIVHLRGFLRTLTPRQRAIIEAVWVEERSQADVAREFNISRMAVCKTLKKVTLLAQDYMANHMSSTLSA